MNRTMFRGVSVGAIAVGLTGVIVVAAPTTFARGAVGATTAVTNSTAVKGTPSADGMRRLGPQWSVSNLHKRHHHHHPKQRQAPQRASRASTRTALTGSPQTIAHAMVLREGWSESEWTCLSALWTRESNWNTYATNASSGAYGIPQALPAYKMASAGSDWRSNPVTQIRWGIGYIAATYGTPCAALSHSSSYGYY